MLQNLTECFFTRSIAPSGSTRLAQHVFRGAITETKARELQLLFEKDTKTGPWKEVIIPEQAFDLSAPTSPPWGQLGVRTLDSLHVACALELKPRSSGCSMNGSEAKEGAVAKTS